MTDVRLLYVTMKDVDEGRRITQELLKRGLIACANLIPQMEAHYFWQGQPETANETVAIFKTRESLVAGAIAAIEELHGYETPCVLSIKVDSGSAGYLDWLSNQVAGQ